MNHQPFLFRCLAIGSGTLFCTFALPATPVRAQGPYGQLPNTPTAFAMATAGKNTGNGVGLLSDNNILDPAASFTQINAGPVASANAGTYTMVPGNTGTARANATFGTFGLFAQFTDGDNTNQENHAAAIADAGWLDRLTFSNPALTGQTGIMNFSIFTEGVVIAGDPTGSAGLYIGVSNGAGGDFSARSFAGQANNVPGDFTLSVSESTNFSLPFTFGSPLTMMVRGVAVTRLSGVPPPGVGSSGLADFENTVYWNGIQSVITATGAPVSVFTLASASGADYRQSFGITAAPEPGTFALLGSASLGLLFGVPVYRRLTRRSA